MRLAASGPPWQAEKDTTPSTISPNTTVIDACSRCLVMCAPTGAQAELRPVTYISGCVSVGRQGPGVSRRRPSASRPYAYRSIAAGCAILFMLYAVSARGRSGGVEGSEEEGGDRLAQHG